MSTDAPNSTQYRQIQCSGVDDGAMLIVNVDAAHKLKPGMVVTFKETGRKSWRVDFCYHHRVYAINRGWGLNLPKSERTER